MEAACEKRADESYIFL